MIRRAHLRHSGIGNTPVHSDYWKIIIVISNGADSTIVSHAQTSLLPGRIDVLSYKGRKRGLDLNSSTLFRHKSFYCREVERWGN